MISKEKKEKGHDNENRQSGLSIVRDLEDMQHNRKENSEKEDEHYNAESGSDGRQDEVGAKKASGKDADDDESSSSEDDDSEGSSSDSEEEVSYFSFFLCVG